MELWRFNDLLADAEAIAVKRVIVFQLEKLMKEQKLDQDATGTTNEDQPFRAGAAA